MKLIFAVIGAGKSVIFNLKSRIPSKSILGFAGHTCESGWSYDGASGCYKVLDTPTNWKDAKKACEEIGATLAVPTDSTVSDIIVSS